eukprot:Opistho-2@60376
MLVLAHPRRRDGDARPMNRAADMDSRIRVSLRDPLPHCEALALGRGVPCYCCLLLTTVCAFGLLLVRACIACWLAYSCVASYCVCLVPFSTILILQTLLFLTQLRVHIPSHD